MKDQIKELFEGISDRQLKPLSKIVNCIVDQGIDNEITNAELAIRAGVQEADVESSVWVFQEVHKKTHDFSDMSGGLSVLRPAPPRIKKRESGELYVTGLRGAPFKEMLEIFSSKEMRERLEKPRLVFYEGVDADTGVLRFADVDILLSKKPGAVNNSTRLLGTLNKEPSRYWERDEVLEDWYGLNYQDERPSEHLCYDAALAANKTIAAKTGVEDFLIFTTQRYRINPRYLKT